ncbi:MAG TPA: pitrilysin family protein [Blastocatellia bacterium]|nr:pitrilysin family protein [Blastocatellia bacterium]
MRKVTSLLITVAAILTQIVCPGIQTLAQQRHDRPVDNLKFPPLHFSPPKPDKVQLPNGMTLYILEDHEIPAVSMFALIRTGARYDPPGKEGLASLVGTVMRSGGTKTETPDAINEKLEFTAASVETGMRTNYGTASLSALTRDLDSTLPIFADVLMNPDFRQEQIDIARGQVLDALRRENDSPQGIAGRIFPQLIYGKDNPIVRSTTEETIKSITRDDLIQFHGKYYHPNNVILGITGDVNKDAIVKKVDDAFAGWKEEKTDLPSAAEITSADKKGIYFVQKDIDQTTVRVGNLGVKEDDPDYFTITVANTILGGGFSSRIVNELRTKEGLAYAASAGQAGGEKSPGYFFTFSETRADATIRGIQTILRVIEGMREEPVTDEELSIAKESALNSFVFAFDSPEKIVNRIVTLDYLGLPPDFLERYRNGVAAVTKEDVLRVSKKYYHPDEATILVVGNEKAFDKPLSTLGTVTKLNLDDWK